MSHHASHRVTVDLARGYKFLVHFDDLINGPTLVCDEPSPLGAGEGPNAAAILGAAVGNCLAASLAFCLRKARVEPASLRAEVTTHVDRDGRGRLRISGIDVVLSPELLAGANTKRCEDLFEDFCTVTASVRRGIPVSVSLKNVTETAA
ncbi:MAG TPA: OsmC family protein [Vicinamibacterales bacterium]|jgi:uncharacterized OsmC-like protein|nr:OsmC family protein [Vicinamibacterales bacterium]